jgi:hypothetical protein
MEIIDGDYRNYGSLSGLQVFSPSRARDRTVSATPHEVPLEVLLDRRFESKDFDRLVSQTDATLQVYVCQITPKR